MNVVMSGLPAPCGSGTDRKGATPHLVHWEDYQCCFEVSPSPPP